MNRGSTLFLRFAIIVIGLITLAICGITFSELIQNRTGEYAPILIGAYVSAIPFFIALYQSMKLLGYIDKNKPFSAGSVKALKTIKYAALIFGLIYTLGLPYIYFAADNDDAPGVIVIGLFLAGGGFVIATFAAVAQKLFQNAVDIKSENDLTV